MKIKVIAPFEIPGLDGDDGLEIAAGTRAGDLAGLAGSAQARMLPIVVNGRQVGETYALAEGDIVMFVFPMGGG